MNTSATINVFRLIYNPALCLPQATISNFNQLPLPLSSAFVSLPNEQKPDIRAVVLDKDNCFAKPKENTVYQPYNEKFQALRVAYPGSRLLIVSNSAGTHDDDEGKEARLLEAATGIKVLRHSTKKPGCGPQIMEYFRNHAADANVTSPDQIAVVGDRLSTDVMMANMMGFWSIWIKDGVVDQKNLVTIAMGISLVKLSVTPRLRPTKTLRIFGAIAAEYCSTEAAKHCTLPGIDAWLNTKARA